MPRNLKEHIVNLRANVFETQKRSGSHSIDGTDYIRGGSVTIDLADVVRIITHLEQLERIREGVGGQVEAAEELTDAREQGKSTK